MLKKKKKNPSKGGIQYLIKFAESIFKTFQVC